MTGDLQNLDPAVRALLPGYLTNRRKDLEVFKKLLAAEQVDEIRRLGHNIKGSGGSYGLDDFTEIGNNIEQAALANDIQTLTRLLEDFEQCTKRLAEKLNI